MIPGSAALDELQGALNQLTGALQAGRPPLAAAEECFETAAVAISKLRAAGTLEPSTVELVLEVVKAEMECGRRLFEADRNATSKLDQILSWSKHLAGTLAGPELTKNFDEAYQDWHWHGW